MNRWLASQVIIPLHEWLLGRSTLRYFHHLEASQWWSPDDLRRLQTIKLAALLHHAAARTPFYRDRFARCGFDLTSLSLLAHRSGIPDACFSMTKNPRLADGTSPSVQRNHSTNNPTATDPRELLSGLPLLTKDDIRSARDAMTWRDAPGGVVPYSTGGSTGEPLQFYIDRSRQSADQAARWRSHRWFGVERGDRELYLWGSPIEWRRTDSLRRIRDHLFNHRLLSAFEMSPDRLDRYLFEWNRFRPVSLFGYPSSIALFVDHAQRCGRTLDVRALKAVFVTGEVCLDADRTRIEAYFGVPVADGYGSREAGFIAHQCPSGNYHITAESLIVEILRDDQPVPDGEIGEIVITHLDAWGMPLIRYRTGDLGRLKPGRCPCGRGLPLMDIVQGRVTDHLCFPDGTVKHALSIIYPLREMPRVRRFRVIQASDGGVTIEVVADRSRVMPDEIARTVRPVVGGAVPLDIKFVEDIPVLESGKHRYVISHAVRACPPDAATNATSPEIIHA